MKIFDLKSLLLCGVMGLFTCCNTQVRGVAENKVTWDSLVVKRTYHMMNVDTNPACSLHVKFIYPTDFPDINVLNATKKQFILDYFGSKYADLSPELAAAKYAEDFVLTFKEDEKDFAKEKDTESRPSEIEDSWYDMNETASNHILYNRNNLLSFMILKESYNGGAHSAHSYTNRVIDLSTGLRITEKELFREDYQDDLAKIIVECIALANNVGDALELENIGFFNIKEIYPNKNFYVDEMGITYIFNEYEIAAYALGAVTVRIPYEKIRHLLLPSAPIASLAF